MEKKLNSRELATIKRICQNVDSNFQKVKKYLDKISEIQEQIADLQGEIDEMEAPVIRKTGGYKSTDLVEKLVIPQVNEDGTPKLSKDGHPVKVTKFVLKYPETIFPPVTETLENSQDIDSSESTDTEETFENNNSFTTNF